ncbi:unnamed protein product [Alopecurus aequalis]
MLKPFYSTPHPLAGEMVPLTLFDRATFNVFIPHILVYPAPTPSNEALKEGLGRAVALYPHLAGRLAVDHEGRRCLHINNEGVLVVEAAVPVDLSNVVYAGSSVVTNTDGLYPAPPLEEHSSVALLHVKLNRYRCGGLVIGLTSHHQAADGLSMSTFFTTWASAVRQGRDFTAPSPLLDRGITVVPRTVSTPVLFDHRTTEFKEADPVVPLCEIEFKNMTVRYTAEFVAGLKARVGTRCSTFECLLAHLWKKVTAARGLTPEELTQVRDVLSRSYAGVVRSIREAVERIDAEYIQSFVDFGTMSDAHGEDLTGTAGTMCCPNLEVDSSLGFNFHQVDFGGGPPAAFQLPDLPVEGLMIFMPSCVSKGGVDVYMTVAGDHAMTFEQTCHSMDSGPGPQNPVPSAKL